jgi:signal transduction histidine kinase
MAPVTKLHTWVRPRFWPVAAKIPALVVAFMIAVSVAVTNGVLTRLIDSQNRHLNQLSGAYLDGVSSALLPPMLRDDVWEVYDVLERASQRYRGLHVDWTTVTDATGVVVASSQPRRFPLQSRLPLDVLRNVNGEVAMIETQGLASLKRDLVYQDRSIGTVFAQVRIGPLIEERRDVLRTLLLTNIFLTLTLAAVAYLLIRRMLRPLRTLSKHMREGATGNVSPIDDALLPRPQSEFGSLFRRYNLLVEAVSERERLLGRLAEEERLAALGRLASGMAHEINNPLGGMLNALDALKRHGEHNAVRQTSTRLLEQGLTGIRDVVRSTLATYRQDREVRELRSDDLEDLSYLLKPEINRRKLELSWMVELGSPVRACVADVRSAALNLLLNACAASPDGGSIVFKASSANNILEIIVEDQGGGLPDKIRTYLRTGSTNGSPPENIGGLGLWMVKRYVAECGGRLEPSDRAPGGTSLHLIVPSSSRAEAASCRLQVA